MKKELNQQDVVDDPLIHEVILTETGRLMNSAKLLHGDRRDIAILRLEYEDAILRGDPISRCAACHQAIKPRLSPLRRRFFRHYKGDGNCPYRTSGPNNQRMIDAMRYNGIKEGLDHIRLKELLESSLKADTSFGSDIKVEKHWWGAVDTSKWRKPDVAAYYRKLNLRVAFEIQLSSTFINVMAERRRFYLENGGLLFWIFKNAQTIEPRQFQDDILYNNNSNLFIIDEETTQCSREQSRLILRSLYKVPKVNRGNIIEEWEERLVGFDELTIEADRQRAWWYDTEGELSKANDEISKQKTSYLRERFEQFWVGIGKHPIDDEHEYHELRILLENNGIKVPDNYRDGSFAALLNILYSAKHGKPVGTYHYTKFVEVAHKMAETYPRYLRYFADVVAESGTKQLLKEGDTSGKWQKRKGELWEMMKSNVPEVAPDLRYANLVRLLFPCCEATLARFAPKE